MFPLTAFGVFWGVLFTLVLLVAAVSDIRTRRIPNISVAVLLLSGFVFSLTTRPVGEGLLTSLLGGALGFALFIAFWPLGLIGAGDVKLFAAAGVWLGPSATWIAALATAIVGGLMSVASLTTSRQFAPALRRILLAVSSRSAGMLAPPPEHVAARSGHIPYGVAIAVGALFSAWRPTALG